MRRYFLIFPLVLIFGFLLVMPFSKAKAAGSVTGADMIALINGWRASYWDNALIEEAYLDSCAQWTAEEMASINAGNHLAFLGYTSASDRCANFGFGSGNTVFVTENWAKHYNMDIDTLASYWSDADHMLPATSQQYKYVGVGIATASDGATYYVLQAGAISGEKSGTAAGSTTSSNTTSDATEDTSNYISPIITSTPNIDGDIYHVVQYGQALYDIATYYGVGYEQIKTLNALTSDTIYVGQSLLVRLAPTVTITPTRTITVMMPTRTQTMTPVPTTPRPTHTITPTPTTTRGINLPKIDRQWLGLGLLIISAIGFFVVFYFQFIRPIWKKPAAGQPQQPQNRVEIIPDVKPAAESKAAAKHKTRSTKTAEKPAAVDAKVATEKKAATSKTTSKAEPPAKATAKTKASVKADPSAKTSAKPKPASVEPVKKTAPRPKKKTSE